MNCKETEKNAGGADKETCDKGGKAGRNKGLVSLTESAVIAALYAVLTVALAPASYGPIQLRVSEALTILPVRKKSAIAGLTVGCVIANTLGILLGADSLGVPDIIFGTLATFLAAVAARLTRNIKIGKLPVLSALMPVISNGLIIGAELTLILHLPFVITSLEVAAGELIAALLLGLPLNAFVEKTGLLKEN